MKIWAKVHIKDKNKEVDEIAKSLTNYIYGYGPILDLTRKYKITSEDRKKIDQYSANRIAGLLMFYLSKDYTRINDVINKYNITPTIKYDISPEIEGYVNKK